MSSLNSTITSQGARAPGGICASARVSVWESYRSRAVDSARPWMSRRLGAGHARQARQARQARKSFGLIRLDVPKLPAALREDHEGTTV